VCACECEWLRLGPDLCVRAVWRAGRGYIGHAMLRVMTGMRKWGLRRFPQRDP